MTGVEVLAGAAVAYLVRKLRRVGDRADAEMDRALDASMDAVHDLVSARLGKDPALAAFEEQVVAGGESERTVRRVTDAIADAAETDPQFAMRLGQLVEQLRACEQASGSVASGRQSVALGGANTGIISTGFGVANVQQQAKASDGGRVYQSGRDQIIHDR